MRLLVYNIRYAVGAGMPPQIPVPGAGYLFGNPGTLDNIIDFIKSRRPDVVGLIEVDVGSVRSGGVNQAESIAGALGQPFIYPCPAPATCVPAAAYSTASLGSSRRRIPTSWA